MASPFINVKALSKRIAEVRAELAELLHLERFSSGSPKKRGRPAKSQNTGVTKATKASGKRGRKVKKRGVLGESILKFLGTKGKEGAHVKDIASQLGTKPANVTAWFYTTGKSKVKKVKPATFAIKD